MSSKLFKYPKLLINEIAKYKKKNSFQHFKIESCLNYKETALCVKSLQSCLTLCNSMDYNPPGSSVQGILQARILWWVAMSFSRRSS